MADLVARGCVDVRGAAPGREMAAIRESGDVPYLDIGGQVAVAQFWSLDRFFKECCSSDCSFPAL